MFLEAFRSGIHQWIEAVIHGTTVSIPMARCQMSNPECLRDFGTAKDSGSLKCDHSLTKKKIPAVSALLQPLLLTLRLLDLSRSHIYYINFCLATRRPTPRPRDKPLERPRKQLSQRQQETWAP